MIGDLDPARRLCAALSDGGHHVVHLLRPSDDALAAHLGRRPDPESAVAPDAVAVIVRGDVAALRYALLTEHLLPRIRLVVTIFDRTVGDQLLRSIPNCTITSPAEVSVPSIIAGCLGDDVLTVDARSTPVVVHRVGPHGPLAEIWRPSRIGLGHMLSRLPEQLRRNDEASRMMVLGLAGLVAVLLTDVTLRVLALHESVLDAFFTSTHVLAAVGFVESDHHEPSWYRLVSSTLVLVTIALTAIFTAGVVDRLLSARHTGLVGRRTIPVREHVVVIGLGQVGLRLCLQLKEMGIRVLAVERDPQAVNLRLSRAAGIPVLIGNAADRHVIHRMSLPRARALAAMGSEDLDNVEATIAARAVAPDVRIILRAGEGDVIKESQSLFRIGQVRDVSALTAVAVTRAVLADEPALVYQRGDEIRMLEHDDDRVALARRRCEC